MTLRSGIACAFLCLLAVGCGPSEEEKRRKSLEKRADRAYAIFEGAAAGLTSDVARCGREATTEGALYLITAARLARTMADETIANDVMTHKALRLPPRSKLDVKNPRTARALDKLWPKVELMGVIVPDDSATTANPLSELRIYSVSDKGAAGLPCAVEVEVDAEGLRKAGYKGDESGVETASTAATGLRQTLCRGVGTKISDALSKAGLAAKLQPLECQ